MVIRHRVRDRKAPSGPTSAFSASATLAAAVAVGSVVTEFTATVTGVRTTDRMVVNPTAALSTGSFLSHSRVSAANVVSIGIGNLTTLSITQTATFNVEIFRE